MTARHRQPPERSDLETTTFRVDGLAGSPAREARDLTPAPLAPLPARAGESVPGFPKTRPVAGRGTNRQSGFTLGEIVTVAGIIGLVATIAIPNFVRAREQAQIKSIVNNLRIIEAAKDTYALETRKGTGSTTDMMSISRYLKGGTVKLVVNETYTTGKIGTAASAKAPVALGTYTAKKKISSP